MPFDITTITTTALPTIQISTIPVNAFADISFSQINVLTTLQTYKISAAQLNQLGTKIQYFYFGNNLLNTINLLKYKNLSFIYTWDKYSTKQQAFTIKNFCKKNGGLSTP